MKILVSVSAGAIYKKIILIKKKLCKCLEIKNLGYGQWLLAKWQNGKMAPLFYFYVKQNSG